MKNECRIFWSSIFLSVMVLFFSAPAALHAAPGDLINETFDLSATQNDIASVYPDWQFIPAGGDNATVSVTGGQLRLGGDSFDSTSFRFKTAPAGAFTLDVDLGAFPGDHCRNVGIKVGENNIVFHPGYPGTALRVEGTGGFGNTDTGFTLAAEILHHFRLLGDGLGNFTVTLTDGLDGNNTFSSSFSNPLSANGLLSITRASCPGYYGEVVADNFNLVQAAASACINPPAGMIGWWPGDGNAYAMVAGNAGTLLGGASFAPGMVGQAFSLDGEDDSVMVPDRAGLNFGVNDFTVDLWVNFRDLSASQVIIEKYIETIEQATGVPRTGWGITTLGGNTLRLYGAVPTDTAALIPDMTVQADPNTWHFLAITRSNDVFTVFWDGSAVQSGTAAVNLDTTASLKFGHRGDPNDTPGSIDTSGYYLNGLIDEVELFNRSLSASEIKAIYDAGSAGKCRANYVPVANAGPGRTIACNGPDGASVTLDGSLSFDPDGDALTYTWTWDGGSAIGVNPFVTMPLGATTVTLTVDDGKGGTSQAAVTIIVQDDLPPTVAVSASPQKVCSGDHDRGSKSHHDRVAVLVSGSATDSGSGIASVVITVTDWQGDFVMTVPGFGSTIKLEAGRDREGRHGHDKNGGYYTITAVAFDKAGNQSTATTTVNLSLDSHDSRDSRDFHESRDSHDSRDTR